MITRIEIDGFKTFDRFVLDLRPFTAVVGPNASGKSNLFDAIKFVSRLAQTDIREAMLELRGRPEELFRRTSTGRSDRMAFAVEVLLEPHGLDAFGKSFELRTQRVRYELEIAVRTGADRRLEGVYVQREQCSPIGRREERTSFAWNGGSVRYGRQGKPFIATRSGSGNESDVIEIRQDGPGKRGRPLALSATEASRTGLSTVTTAEFPHLYALRTLLSSVQFLQIDPQASRRATDRLAPRRLLPDASNLATVLARLMEETRTDRRPKGFLSDVVADLSSLIPSVADLDVRDDPGDSEYSFDAQAGRFAVFQFPCDLGRHASSSGPGDHAERSPARRRPLLGRTGERRPRGANTGADGAHSHCRRLCRRPGNTYLLSNPGEHAFSGRDVRAEGSRSGRFGRRVHVGAGNAIENFPNADEKRRVLRPGERAHSFRSRGAPAPARRDRVTCIWPMLCSAKGLPTTRTSRCFFRASSSRSSSRPAG